VVDEQIKVIGSLRIGIPLYNVYLNEADEWSRRLATEVGEWALELNRQVPDSAVGLAHALGGSSATVGFHTLSEIARALEHALQATQLLAYGTPQHGQAFIAAAEEIRRLLHQFAAGFLKDSDTRVLQALAALENLDVPKRADLPEPDPFALDAVERVDSGFVVVDAVPEAMAPDAVQQSGTVVEAAAPSSAMEPLTLHLVESVAPSQAVDLLSDTAALTPVLTVVPVSPVLGTVPAPQQSSRQGGKR
jgi:chemosensory pili system protein ChpA (sensor histidine kinase/response regulator)